MESAIFRCRNLPEGLIDLIQVLDHKSPSSGFASEYSLAVRLNPLSNSFLEEFLIIKRFSDQNCWETIFLEYKRGSYLKLELLHI